MGESTRIQFALILTLIVAGSALSFTSPANSCDIARFHGDRVIYSWESRGLIGRMFSTTIDQGYVTGCTSLPGVGDLPGTGKRERHGPMLPWPWHKKTPACEAGADVVAVAGVRRACSLRGGRHRFAAGRRYCFPDRRGHRPSLEWSSWHEGPR